ncbi:MAG: glutamate synthase central domain-containing protein, partial [Alphaproteobacteria bacterium]
MRANPETEPAIEESSVEARRTARAAAERDGLYRRCTEHDACGVGFVAQMKGVRSHDIVEKGLRILQNLTHRGACGCDPLTGDGAGILMQMPHEFLSAECAKAGLELPREGMYGAGLVFLPTDIREQNVCLEAAEKIVREERQRFIGWRDVPVDPSVTGPVARETMPAIRMLLVGAGPGVVDQATLERKLFVIRKRAEHAIRASNLADTESFYVASLSSRTIVYKGLLLPDQIPAFFADLRDPRMKSAIALVHQRFSTNTFPSWDRAHPYRYIAHNGEINTLRGNENWMRAREPLFVSETFGDDVERIRPVVDEDSSDSGKFDNALELLVHTGRSLPHAVMMMIPEAWQKHESMSASKREFYEYHSCLMEPWDGPASIAFSDGTVVGAILDRNGLRPSRYVVTRDGLVVMASEVGVLDIPPSEIVQKNRLQPGRMFLVDLSQGRIVDDEEIKEGMAARRPYGEWLRDNLVRLGDLPAAGAAAPAAHSPDDLRRLQLAFGYTLEDLRFLMGPMAVEGQEAIGSMGTDTPLAVLSDKPQLLFNYFKQLFAQVTNPPIDPIREELVMSLRATVGAERNLFEETPLHCRQLSLETPILRDEELAAIRANGREGLRAETVSTLWEPTGGVDALDRALDALCREASAAVARGASIVVLSDRGVDARRAAIPSLLAVAAVHHHLIREGSRKRCGLVLESAEPREVHHFSLLVGYGAGAINPYLAFETLGQQIRDGVVKGIDEKEAVDHFVKAVDKGLLKVM